MTDQKRKPGRPPKESLSCELDRALAKTILFMMNTSDVLPLSQSELGRKSGLSQPTISSVLRGDSPTWSIYALNRIAKAFSMAEEDLITAAREYSKNGTLFPYACRLNAYEKNSPSRMVEIVKYAVGYESKLAKLMNEQSVQHQLPLDSERYLKGEIGDGELYNTARKWGIELRKTGDI